MVSNKGPVYAVFGGIILLVLVSIFADNLVTNNNYNAEKQSDYQHDDSNDAASTEDLEEASNEDSIETE
tara:strand:+ start:181 stop:387 length:207 start_codon:yes stop_codon:yes gene_type:complete